MASPDGRRKLSSALQSSPANPPPLPLPPYRYAVWRQCNLFRTRWFWPPRPEASPAAALCRFAATTVPHQPALHAAMPLAIQALAADRFTMEIGRWPGSDPVEHRRCRSKAQPASTCLARDCSMVQVAVGNQVVAAPLVGVYEHNSDPVAAGPPKRTARRREDEDIVDLAERTGRSLEIRMAAASIAFEHCCWHATGSCRQLFRRAGWRCARRLCGETDALSDAMVGRRVRQE